MNDTSFNNLVEHGGTVGQITILGSIDIPAISYGGDSIVYHGPIEKLFHDVTGWDHEKDAPIGELPRMYVDKTGFDVRVIGSNGRVIKSIVAVITGMLGYTIDQGSVYLRFTYRELPMTIGDTNVYHLAPTIAHIHTDPESELITVILEGTKEACEEFAKDNLTTFEHGGKLYHMHTCMRCSVRYARDASGEEKYVSRACGVIAHPDTAVANFDEVYKSYKGRLMRYMGTIYSEPEKEE